MKNEHEEKLCITPAQSYAVPKIPTLKDAKTNPAMLKRLPSRWKRNAAVVACVGVMGMTALTGCANVFSRFDDNGVRTVTRSGMELNIITHHGGAVGSPFYVISLTEQEAFGIIRQQLEIAGLNFGAIPPEYTVNVWEWVDVGLDLFDEEKNVAVANVSWADSHIRFAPSGSWFAEEASEEFAQKTGDIVVGVFYNPGEDIGWSRPSAREQREAIPLLKENLTEQVQAFIALLQEQGILE